MQKRISNGRLSFHPIDVYKLPVGSQQPEASLPVGTSKKTKLKEKSAHSRRIELQNRVDQKRPNTGVETCSWEKNIRFSGFPPLFSKPLIYNADEIIAVYRC